MAWEYSDRPTPLSREYLIRIEYKRGDIPRVFVKALDLTALAGDRELPYVYKKPLYLCLYLPSSGEWKGSMRIGQTIVPWALVWLYYFEEWVSSNEWKGGGVRMRLAPLSESYWGEAAVSNLGDACQVRHVGFG